MKLRTRLIVAFCVILFVPFVMFGITFFGFTQHQLQALEDSYGVSVSLENLSDSMQVIGKSTQQTFERMKEQAQEDPDQFLDQVILDQINQELKDKKSYLLMRKDQELFYNGSEEAVDKLFRELPVFRRFSSASDGGSYIGKDVKAFVKQLDMEFSDGSQGSIFIISSAKHMTEQTRGLLDDLIFSIIVIMFFTAALLTIWIYRGSIRRSKS